MAKWLTLPSEPLIYQPSQMAFLDAKKSRYCRACKKTYQVVAPIFVCPYCQLKGSRLFDRLTIIAGRRFGKGLALDTPIPTPTGWTTMGALSEGDKIFTEQGKTTTVLKTSGINHLDCYKITFSDGQTLVADADHQWLVWSKSYRKALRRSEAPRLAPEVKTTPELLFSRDNRDAVPPSKFFPVRYIANVEKIESVPTKCIEVDNPTALFLAGRGCIPTHNSRIGSLAGVDEAMIPNSVGWACAPTNPKLHRYVIPAFQQLIPQEWVQSWNSEYLDLRLKNGSLIHFQTLEDPDQGRGQGLDWLWIDEVCELTRSHWEVIRPSLAGDTVAFFTTTPRSYDWVYEELYQPAEKGLPGYWACHARTADSANPRISSEFLAREKAQMSDVMYRQEYEADFVTFTGAVYGIAVEPQVLRTDEQIKLVLPEWPQIDPSRQALIGIDTGADHPFGGVKMVMTDRGLVVVGEYLERDKKFIQHAGALTRLAAPHPTRWAINKNERQQSLELAQYGITPQKAENNQVAGIERVKSWLHSGQLWFIEPLCPKTIRQMKSYRWTDNYTKDEQKRSQEQVFKKDDELPDCFVAGTKISTSAGPVNIELLKAGDKVLTRLGEQSVEIVGSRFCPVYTLEFSNGNKLTGTASHPIWTNEAGFVPLENLRPWHTLLLDTQITLEAVPEQLGSQPTDSFQTAMKSITSMETSRTINWKISSAFLRWITRNSIRTSGLGFNQLIESVQHALNRSLLMIRNVYGAQQPARLSFVAIGNSTTSSDNVLSAQLGSMLPSIVTSNIVLDHVERAIISVNKFLEHAKVAIKNFLEAPHGNGAVTVVGKRLNGVQRVYNLAVEKQPEYFANGVLVHNCIRYALMTWPQVPDTRLREAPKRDISGFPPEIQHSIERLRRLEAEPKDPDNALGDFYT